MIQLGVCRWLLPLPKTYSWIHEIKGSVIWVTGFRYSSTRTRSIYASGIIFDWLDTQILMITCRYCVPLLTTNRSTNKANATVYAESVSLITYNFFLVLSTNRLLEHENTFDNTYWRRSSKQYIWLYAKNVARPFCPADSWDARFCSYMGSGWVLIVGKNTKQDMSNR